MIRSRNSARRKTKPPARVGSGTTEPIRKKPLQRVTATGEAGPPAHPAELMAAARRTLARATGVEDGDLSARILDQVSRIQAVWPFGNPSEAFQAATEMMLEIKPASLAEAQLATQMIGVHHAALSCLQRTAFQGKSPEDLDAAARAAARFMRLYMDQLEAMAKLRAKTSQQRDTAEHVQ